MHFKENVILALNGLRANKMRALLTMLGIIIGISSVIAIVTVGTAMTSSVAALLNDMGANSIQFYLRDKPDEYDNIDWTRPYAAEDYITEDMLHQYREAFADKIAAIGYTEMVGEGQAMNGRRQAKGNVTGCNAEGIHIQNVDILAGHFINEREDSGNKSVAVISDQFVEDLFPNTTPQQALGKEVKLRLPQGLYTFTIVGVYHFEVTGFAKSMSGDTASTVFIPNGVAKRITNHENRGYSSVQVRGSSSVADTKAFAKQTEDYFNSRFYRGNAYVQITASSMDSMIGQMTSMMTTMNLAISVIAAISLMVGGIGVMNIMLVSVTERTREIGTRKALGARNSAIRIQFIVESIIICLIGGAIGVLLGTGLGLLASTLLGEPAYPSFSVVAIAVGFSMAIGVFFGYYPANKAAKLDPIEALRYE